MYIEENFIISVLCNSNCGVTSPINRIYGSGTHMVAPEAYKPYVGGNSNRCGTCDYNYKV